MTYITQFQGHFKGLCNRNVRKFIDDIRHVHYLCFSSCLVEGTHREHVQLVKVDEPDVAHVDGTLSMLNMSRIHNSKSVRGRWLLLTGCVSSNKSAMAS